MRIESVRIQNLRAFKDETVRLDRYTCLVGPNGAGKSTVLCALNIFFRSSEDSPTDLTALLLEDFHRKDTSSSIRITVTFGELGAEAAEDFKDYVRQGKLVISAVAEWDPISGRAPVHQVGERLAIKAFKPFFAALGDGATVADLRPLFAEAQKAHPEIAPAKTKGDMEAALREYETAHSELCELIPSKDEFYGFTRGANRLAKYVQWVFVPAVKDPLSEQQESRDGALGRLLARTVKVKSDLSTRLDALRAETEARYQEVLDGNQGVLDGISTSLKQRLMEWAHPEAALRVRWHREDKSVRVDEPVAKVVAAEGEFEGDLARFGHGFQRSYLLALLQELAGCGSDGEPTLILACEEPELFQHPPQARHLASVLQRLSGSSAQVVVCTHSPYFVPGHDFAAVRLVRKRRGAWSGAVSAVTQGDIAQEMARVREAVPVPMAAATAKLYQELQPLLNEMFFTQVLVLVEGMEDVAHLASCLALMGVSEEFRRLGCHIVPTNGKSHMMQPRSIAKLLNIPTFTVFDADGHQPDKNGSREKHRKDNLALLRLCGASDPNPFPGEHYWGAAMVMWKSEMGEVVKEEMGAEWTSIREQLCGVYGGALEKNALFIGDLLERAWQTGKKCNSLERLCESILSFARSAGG